MAEILLQTIRLLGHRYIYISERFTWWNFSYRRWSLKLCSNRDNLGKIIFSQGKQWLVMALLQSMLSVQRSYKEKLCLICRSVLAVSLPDLST